MKAIFHSFRKDSKASATEEGCKSALVIVKENAFTFGGIAVFVPAIACAGKQRGDIIDLGEVTIIDMVDNKTGEVMKHSSGNAFKCLQGA